MKRIILLLAITITSIGFSQNMNINKLVTEKDKWHKLALEDDFGDVGEPVEVIFNECRESKTMAYIYMFEAYSLIEFYGIKQESISLVSDRAKLNYSASPEEYTFKIKLPDDSVRTFQIHGNSICNNNGGTFYFSRMHALDRLIRKHKNEVLKINLYYKNNVSESFRINEN